MTTKLIQELFAVCRKKEWVFNGRKAYFSRIQKTHRGFEVIFDDYTFFPIDIDLDGKYARHELQAAIDKIKEL